MNRDQITEKHRSRLAVVYVRQPVCADDAPRQHLLADFGLLLGNSSNRGPLVELTSRHQHQHAPEIIAQGRHGGPGQ